MNSRKDFIIKNGVLIKYRGSSLDVYIPYGVTAISDGAFADHRDLDGVKIPKSVTFIGEKAFSHCYRVVIRASEGSYAANYAKQHGHFFIQLFHFDPEFLEQLSEEERADLLAVSDMDEIDSDGSGIYLEDDDVEDEFEPDVDSDGDESDPDDDAENVFGSNEGVPTLIKTITFPLNQNSEERMNEASITGSQDEKTQIAGNPLSRDHLPKFTYRDGLSANGKYIVMDIPDGFRIETDVEERDFIAYLPNPDCPDDYTESNYIIMSGKVEEYDNFDAYGIVQEFVGLARVKMEAISMQLAVAGFERMEFQPYRRADLPGGICLGCVKDTIHVNLIVGISGGLQTLRLQIGGVERRDRSSYDSVIRGILDHVHAKKPVTLIDTPDSKKYFDMTFTEELAEQWAADIEKNIDHIGLSTRFQSKVLVELCKQGYFDYDELKKKLQATVEDSIACLEELIRACESIYEKEKNADPKNPALMTMRDALYQCDLNTYEIAINDDHIMAASEYLTDLKKRFAPSEAELAAKREKEEKQKAEREKKAKEEAAKREKKAKEEAAKREKETKEIQAARDADYAKAKAALEEQHRRNLKKARQEWDKEEENKLQLEKEKQKLTESLSTLGIFQIKQKIQMQSQLSVINKSIAQSTQQIADLKSRFHYQEAELQASFERRLNRKKREVERAYPLPEEESKDGKSELNENLADKILKIMVPGKLYTVVDINTTSELSNFTAHKVYALLTQLVSRGRVERVEKGGKIYYRLL